MEVKQLSLSQGNIVMFSAMIVIFTFNIAEAIAYEEKEEGRRGKITAINNRAA